MRQHFAIVVTVVFVIVVLVVVNAASYVEIERAPDSEYNPDRSTYNAGATGVRALYDYLQESGYRVLRWREEPAKLHSAAANGPGTFVVVGSTRVPFETEEVEDLLDWVESGGRLVIVDRSPDPRLLPSVDNWYVNVELQHYPTPDARSGKADDMTAGVSSARAAQPTTLTVGVDSVLPSRFASVIKIYAQEGNMKDGGAGHTTDEDAPQDDYRLSGRSMNPGAQTKGARSSAQPPPPVVDDPAAPSPAPVVHLVDDRGALLADYAYGDGRIILLSDPFIIANSGINRADNLRLTINTIAGGGGLIAFDEYHQGRAITHNQLLSYFEGTPVLAMLGQLGLIVLVVLWTRGRRFARPLPLPFVDRRSKLEFVASMAELQQRARAYDLAIENIYTRTRRVLARYAGLNSNSPREEIAARVAARSKLNAEELEKLMRDCEDAMAGEPLGARRALNLAARLREVERGLGLRMRTREIKQAKER
jgi:hypothetical protein